MRRLFHFIIVGRPILSGKLQFVCLKSWEKFEKRTREDESLFTMTTRGLTLWLKPAPFWPAKTSMDYPPYSQHLTFFYLFWFLFIPAYQEKTVWSTIFDAFKNHVLAVSQSKWKNCFIKWFERKCINTLKNNKTIFDNKYSHFYY